MNANNFGLNNSTHSIEQRDTIVNQEAMYIKLFHKKHDRKWANQDDDGFQILHHKNIMHIVKLVSCKLLAKKGNNEKVLHLVKDGRAFLRPKNIAKKLQKLIEGWNIQSDALVKYTKVTKNLHLIKREKSEKNDLLVQLFKH